MKRFVFPLLAFITLPTSIQADFDSKVYEMCIKATDFEGCVKTMYIQKYNRVKKSPENLLNTKNKSNKFNGNQLITIERRQSNSFYMAFRLPINLSSSTRVKKVTYKSDRTSIKKVKKEDKFNFHFDRGYEKEKLGDFKGAISEYDKAVQINPYDADIYYFRGWAKANKTVYDLNGAIDDLKKLNQLEPNNVKNLLDLAAMYSRANKNSKAFPLIEQAIALDPSNGNLLWWKGMFQISKFKYVSGCRNARDGKYLGASDYDPTMREICY